MTALPGSHTGNGLQWLSCSTKDFALWELEPQVSAKGGEMGAVERGGVLVNQGSHLHDL